MGTQKPTLKRITQIANNEEAAVALFNDNFKTIEESIKDSVSRSGLLPTNMSSELDMGGKRIINVGEGTGDSDVVTYGQVKDALKEAQKAKQYLQDAENARDTAEDWSDLANNAKRGAEEAEANAREAEAGAKAHEDNAQMIYDELITNEAVKTVHENIEVVKDVAGNMGDIEDTLENMEFIKGAVYASKTISFGNIGDIRATYANVPPKGCRFTDGTEIKREDYPEVFDKMDAGEIAFHTVAYHQQCMKERGMTGSFGYDKGSNVAYLPLLTEAFVEATNTAQYSMNDAGLPNITGEAGNYGNGTGANYYSSGAMYVRNYDGVVGESEDTQGISSIYGIDASRSSAVYGKSNTVQPKSVKLRHYVILSNQHQMILNMKEQVSSVSALPKTGNINGDVRVVKDGNIAYVWVMKADGTGKWESVGKVGTSG
jgi:hypothetical protein